MSCEHNWDILETIDVVENENDKVPVSKKFILRCNKCGEITVRIT